MSSPSSSEEIAQTPVVETPAPASAPVETPAPQSDAPKDANAAVPDPPTAKPSVADDKDAKTQPTLAEVLKSAATLDADGKPSAPAKEESKLVEPVAQAPDAKLDSKEEDLPFHNHPRWKEVIGERDTLKDQVSKLEPDAQQYQKITTFMTTHELTPEEVGDGFVLMAMIKAGDPRAVERLDHYRGLMARATGDLLPNDLQSRINDGTMTEDAALEVSRARAQAARVNADNAKLREAETKRNAAQADRAVVVDLQKATDEWVSSVSSKDPDFAKKEPVIERYAQALMVTRGRPKNKAEAKQLMDDAYTEVNRTFKSVMPAKQPAQNIPSAGSSNGAKPVPKSLADVVRLAAAAG